ncbi:MAG: SCO family protein [Hyphomicrobiaceae bacterium]
MRNDKVLAMINRRASGYRGLLPSLAWLLSLVMAALASAGPAVSAGPRWGEKYLPNVKLVTQNEQTVRFYQDVLKDKITVISFIYTSCREICPLITARLAQVYEQLGSAAGREIQFVSISIDPEVDTPARLKQHAEAFRADAKWLFLTGTLADINSVRRKLGERSRRLTEHAAQVIMYNDRTGEWSRDSAFADLGALALAIQSMDPGWRAVVQSSSVPGGKHSAASLADELPGQALFIKACAACHSIGQGDGLGPDLGNVSARREKDWLVRFIRAPSRLHAEKDPIAIELASRFPKVRMPNLQLSESDVVDIVAYVEARSFAAAASEAEGGAAHHHHGSATTGHAHGVIQVTTPDHGAAHGHHGSHPAEPGKPHK